MRTLHVAAMPFPTQQGTQGLLHSMLDALASAGHDPHLLCYGEQAFERATSYRVHRVQALAHAGSLRSGPSLAKLVKDVRLARALPALIRGLQPQLVVAHHVEAALAAAIASPVPVLLVAHTSLSAELGSYFPTGLAALCRASGRALDRLLCRSVARVVAVSPLLAERLAVEAAVPVYPLRLPWSVPPEPTSGEALEARRVLGLTGDQQVVLYAGNLDAYQGLPVLARGIAELCQSRAALRWLIATESPPRQLAPLLDQLGISARVLFAPLASEQQRRLVHAAADVAVVPRQCPGGIPIKLLDALARGVAVVAPRRALAGLPLEQACQVIVDDDATAFAHALDQLLAVPEAARQLASAGRSALQRTHRGDQFVVDFQRHVEACLASWGSSQAGLAGFFRAAIDE